MNTYHAYAIDGGKAKIMREVNKQIQSIEVSTFKGWCANKSIPIRETDIDGKQTIKELNLFNFWYTHPLRFEYTDVGFDPSKTFDRNNRSIEIYDMWRGWETEGKKPETLVEVRAVKDTLRFIYDIICDKNMTNFYWVMSLL